ncbi:MAG: Coenzyme F420 hydrogenase/dehydrogenase, beta subunit C-terminal domain [Methanosarcinales archaeon]
MKIGECYVGWATDENVRNKGASGGLVTATLAAALKSKLVDKVLVLKKISEYEAVPMHTNNIEEVMKTAGSLHSVPINLAKYITGMDDKTKVALPAKPCDARAIIEQAKRNTINLDNTYIIGLNCGGSMHPLVTREMLRQVYEINPEDVIGEEIAKGKLIFFTKDGEKAIDIDQLEEKEYGRRVDCRYCNVKIPRNADLACGNWGVIGDLVNKATFVEINTEKGITLLNNAIEAGFIEMEPASEKGIAIRSKINSAMESLAKKWMDKIFVPIEGSHLQYYINALENCINCGACKAVCPVCSCGGDSKCLIFNFANDTYKISMFHLIRFLHLSDSCIGCGQCTDVCPVDIPLAQIQRRFSNIIQPKYNYVPGMDLRRPPFLEVK